MSGCICGVIGIGAQHSAACMMHNRFIGPGIVLPPDPKAAEVASLRARVEALEADLTDTRVSHAKLMLAIKAALGYQHWPIIKGNVVDGVCALLTARVEALEGALREVMSADEHKDAQDEDRDCAAWSDAWVRKYAAEQAARRVLGE